MVNLLESSEDEYVVPEPGRMVAVIGTVTPFDSVSQSWEEYHEMLDFFFKANKIEDQARKKAVLLMESVQPLIAY